MVGRPSRPLDPDAGPIQAFATELRKLREEAGNPKYLQMARHSGKSRTALAEAAGGDHLPTWETVAAFVNACKGDLTAWRARWEQVRDKRHVATPTATNTADSQPDAHPTDVNVVEPEPTGQPDAPTELLSRLQLGRLRRLLPFLVTALISAGVAAVVTALVVARPVDDPNTGPSGTGQPLTTNGDSGIGMPASVLITVQNKVALGADRLIEDPSGPAYLCSKTIPLCNGADKLTGTDIASGAQLVATCYINGTEMFNYNLDSTESKNNPHRVASTLWYKVTWADGRSGFIAEVYITPRDRGGKGLSVCG